MADILSNVGSFVNAVISWMRITISGIFGYVVEDNVVTSTLTNGSLVLILFIIALPLCGLGVGILRRMIHTRG